MRTFRLIILAALTAVVLVGCITFADSYSDQNPSAVTLSEAASPTPTPTPDLTAPTLSASQTGANEVTISWTSVTGAAGYRLERRDINPWSIIEGVDIRTGTSFVQTNLAIGKEYKYRVRAVAGDGSSQAGYTLGPWSNVVSITREEPTPTPTPTPVPPTATPTP